MAAPFASRDFHLVPTGGVNENNYLEYLAAGRVVACGMSYMVERKLLQQKDYSSMGSRMDRIVAGLKDMKK